MEPLPQPVDSTIENIAKVKTNLTNMQRFNDLLYTYSITKCANAFLLLSKSAFSFITNCPCVFS